MIDYDKIMVMDSGRLVEFGSPKELLAKDVNEEGAWFARMVAEMGEAARTELIHLAKK